MTFVRVWLIFCVVAIAGCQSTGRFTEKYVGISETESRVQLPESWAASPISRYAFANGLRYHENIRYRTADIYVSIRLSQLKATHHWRSRQTGSEFLKQVSNQDFLRNRKITLGARETLAGGISRVQTWSMLVEKGHGHLNECIGYMDHWGPGPLPANFRNKTVGYICARTMADASRQFAALMGRYDVQPRFYSGEGIAPQSQDDQNSATPKQPHEHFQGKRWLVKLIGHGDGTSVTSCAVSQSYGREVTLSSPTGATLYFSPAEGENVRIEVKAVSSNSLAGEFQIVRRHGTDILHRFEMHSGLPNPRFFETQIDVTPAEGKGCLAALSVKRTQ